MGVFFQRHQRTHEEWEDDFVLVCGCRKIGSVERLAVLSCDGTYLIVREDFTVVNLVIWTFFICLYSFYVDLSSAFE